MEEQFIAITFIQCWQDYLTLRVLDKTEDKVWLNNFLQWAQSPYLKKYFTTLKFNFSTNAVLFGELLFEYAAHIPVPTENSAVYQKEVNNLLKDPRLLKIFNDSANFNVE